MDESTPVGQRIAHYRRKRGLTQQVLAGLVGRSPSWLTKVERGELILDKISVLLTLANALKVEPGALIGGIELPPNGGGPLDPPRGIIGVRRAIVAVRPPDREPPTTAELRSAVEHAHQVDANGSWELATTVLPEVLATGRAAVAEELPGAWGWLSAGYRVATRLARNLVERDIALLAADRAVAAAQRSGDELAVAASMRQLAFSLLGLGLVDEAGSVCSDTAQAAAPADASPVQGWSLWGSLRLTEAIAAVRATDTASAWQLLGDARIAAERVGSGRDDYWESFSPANVGAHEVAVALEAGDPVEAVRIAERVDLDELSNNSRRVRFLVDVAQAHGLRRDDAATVAVLLEAERHAPEAVRYSVLARELVRVCLGRERRSRTPGLRGLAQRIGVTG